MSILMPLDTGVGKAKISLFGFAGSGKSRTAVEFAIGIREHFGLEGPIAYFDTETGSTYLAPLVKKRTGKDLIGIRSRSFDTLMDVGEECLATGVSVLIADS